MLYKSMILPYLNYCNLVRASSYKTSLQRIVILQKCLIRIVNKSDYCAHLDPIFKKLNSYEHYNLVFSCFNLKILFSLENLKLLFTRNNQINGHNTRHTKSFHLPSFRTNTRQFSVFYQGLRPYNSLSIDITGSPSLASFKKKLKKCILDKYSFCQRFIKTSYFVLFVSLSY